jgi:hypothetical protein
LVPIFRQNFGTEDEVFSIKFQLLDNYLELKEEMPPFSSIFPTGTQKKELR